MENNLPTILFEGLDGAGKTYALNHLKKYYEDREIPVHVVDSIPFDKFMESHNKEWFDLSQQNTKYVEYLSWQVNNYYKNILPYLHEKVILIDRFTPSCFAYNDIQGDRFSSFFYKIMDTYLKDFFIPSVTFFVDVSDKVILQRHRTSDQPAHMTKIDFIQTVRANYGRFFDLYHTHGPWINFFPMDGTKDITKLTEEMVEIVKESYSHVG